MSALKFKQIYIPLRCVENIKNYCSLAILNAKFDIDIIVFEERTALIRPGF